MGTGSPGGLELPADPGRARRGSPGPHVYWDVSYTMSLMWDRGPKLGRTQAPLTNCQSQGGIHKGHSFVIGLRPGAPASSLLGLQAAMPSGGGKSQLWSLPLIRAPSPHRDSTLTASSNPNCLLTSHLQMPSHSGWDFNVGMWGWHRRSVHNLCLGNTLPGPLTLGAASTCETS